MSATEVPTERVEAFARYCALGGLDDFAAFAAFAGHEGIEADDDLDLWRDVFIDRYLAAARSEISKRDATPAATVRFVTLTELRASTPPEPEWVWKGYVARRAVTLAAGKPKAGKSTLISALVDALDAGAATFLGRPITPGPVVYISEEGALTFRAKFARDSERVSVVVRENAWPRPSWADLIHAAVAEAERIGAVLLVIDSYLFWSQLAEGQENDSAATGATLAALITAANAGLAVVLIHHQRKSGGEDGDAVRGSGGIFASVDALLEIERVEHAPANQRKIITSGRFVSMAPVLVADYDPPTGAWRIVGEVDDRHEADTLAAVRRIVEALPVSGAGLTERELADTLGEDKRKVSTPLRAAVEDQLVAVAGKGVKGSPYRYTRKLQTQAAHDSAQILPTAEGRIASEDAAPN